MLGLPSPGVCGSIVVQICRLHERGAVPSGEALKCPVLLVFHVSVVVLVVCVVAYFLVNSNDSSSVQFICE